jgi:chromosome segregation ATPase
MHERLSAAAAAKERSISEEIEARLIQSFEVADRRAELVEQLKDHRDRSERLRAEMEAFRKRSEKDTEEREAHLKEAREYQAKHAELRHMIEKNFASAAMVDALLGENETSRAVLRKIALELASNPDWDQNETSRRAIATRIHSYICPPDILGGDSTPSGSEE